MGNLCWVPKVAPVVECIQELQRVERMLQQLIDKYSGQIREHRKLARAKMYNKPDAMQHIRTVNIIRKHKEKLMHRLTSCIAKRYQLESLNVTQMHIEAVRLTSSTFRTFLQQNDVERVAQLQDTLSGMIDDACEINEVLQQPLGPDTIDEDELEDEYEALCTDIQLPAVPSNSAVPSNFFSEEAAELENSDDGVELERRPLTG